MRKEGIDDNKLLKTIAEAEKGASVIDLGGGLLKKSAFPEVAREKVGATERSLYTGLRLWRFLFTDFQKAPRRTLMPLNWMHIKSWLKCSWALVIKISPKR